MREAIERVIAELESAKADTKYDQWDHGWNSAIKLAIVKVKGVLKADDDQSNGQTSTGSKDDTTQ